MDKIKRTQEAINEVKDQLQENIEAIHVRGERLDIMQQKTGTYLNRSPRSARRWVYNGSLPMRVDSLIIGPTWLRLRQSGGLLRTTTAKGKREIGATKARWTTRAETDARYVYSTDDR